MLVIAPIGERMYGNATARGENAFDLDIFRIHKAYQVLHYYIDTILMEISVIPETEKIELKALALHHPLSRNIGDEYLGKIRLTGLRAE